MNLVRSLIHRLSASSLFSLPGLRSRRAEEAVAIIMTHGVFDACMASRAMPPSSSVSLTTFEANIRGLQHHYHFISLDEAVTMIEGASEWRKNCAVLTFDDSMKSLVRLVAPRLATWDIQAVFYVSTQVIETRRPYWWLRLEHALSKAEGKTVRAKLSGRSAMVLEPNQRSRTLRELKAALRVSPIAECEKVVTDIESQVSQSLGNPARDYPHAEIMGWEDVRQLVKLGMTIGSHTVSHPNLVLLSSEELRSELESSRRMIEEQCQIPCRHLCYPYGAYSDWVCEMSRITEYRSAVTTDTPGWNEPGTDVHQLKRFGMPHEPYRLTYLLSGVAETLNACKHRLGTS